MAAEALVGYHLAEVILVHFSDRTLLCLDSNFAEYFVVWDSVNNKSAFVSYGEQTTMHYLITQFIDAYICHQALCLKIVSDTPFPPGDTYMR